MNTGNEHITVGYPEPINLYEAAEQLNEMASDAADYRLTIRSHARQLYDHIIYVCVLGEAFPEMVPHWKEEIKKFAQDAVTLRLKKNTNKLDRAKEIEKEMMAPQMGANFEDYDIEHFEEALDVEFHKAERELKKERNNARRALYKKEQDAILQVRSNLIGLPELNLERIKNFYDKYKEAAKAKDIDMLQAAIDEL